MTSSKGGKHDHDFEDLLAGYFDGTLDGPQLARFADLLDQDDRHIQRFVELAQISQMIASEVTYHAQAQRSSRETDADKTTAQLFAELAQMERSAQTQTVTLDGRKPATDARHPDDADDPGSRSAHDLAAVGGYALRLALTSRPAKKLYAYAAVAAVILLALFIVNPWAGNDGPIDTPIADKQQDNATPTTPVATLTATHNAQWASASAEGASAPGSQLRPGSKLHPNQRLTLTEGFAEITTNRGAVAILQAPATIELLNNDNAIRLHDGKLVGICETESSKGFTVTAPTARIVDISTQFGIDATSQSTQVQVYKGSVHASLLHTSGIGASPVLVTARQALLLRADEEPRRIAFDPQRDTTALKLASRILTEARDPASVPADLRPGVLEADALQIFVEHQGLSLSQHLPVDLHVSGQAVDVKWTSAPAVPAGSRVDVYLLHFDPVDVTGRSVIDGVFTVRFERPIIGVIGSAPLLLTSDNLLKRDTTRYPEDRTNSALEEGEIVHFKVAPDGRSLQFKLTVGEQYIDQFRVIIQAEDPSS